PRGAGRVRGSAPRRFQRVFTRKPRRRSSNPAKFCPPSVTDSGECYGRPQSGHEARRGGRATRLVRVSPLDAAPLRRAGPRPCTAPSAETAAPRPRRTTMRQLILEHTVRLPAPNGALYSPRVYGEDRSDGLWEGWIEFQPLTSRGSVLATGRETTQPNR